MAEVSDVVAAVDVGGTRIKAALVTAAYDTSGRRHDADPEGHRRGHRRRSCTRR